MRFSQKYIISTLQTHFEKSGQLADRRIRGFLDIRQKYRFSRSEIVKNDFSDEN